MKSLADTFLHIAVALLKDVQQAYPAYGGVAKDKERLSHLVRTRGLGFFTLDLPSLDAALTNALEHGLLVLNGPVSKTVSKKIKVPRLFRGLWLRVFTHDACLRVDPDVNSIMFLRQLCCLGKRIEVGCSPQRFEKSLGEYYNVEKELPEPSLRWNCDVLDPDDLAFDLHCGDLLRSHCWFGESVSRDNLPFDSETTTNDWSLLQRFQQNADIVAQSLGEFDPIWFSNSLHESGQGIGFRHGPGAVAERSGQVHKYNFVHWPAKLNAVFPWSHCGKIITDSRECPSSHEFPSKLIAVPKTAKSPRLIAAEPTEHQWCQQLIRRFLEARISGLFGRNFIDFTSQNASGTLALRSSLTRECATVDLSSASDRLSCYVIERVFRRNPTLLHALHASRTRWVVDSLSSTRTGFTNNSGRKPGTEVKYLIPKKFASQGTAVTFPIQTLVFFIAALTSSGVVLKKPSDLYLTSGGFDGGLGRLRNKLRVFGDDIIIPTHGYASLTRLLTLLRLKVNVDKSFYKGYFRESCGQDAYKGYDVTPIRPRSLSDDGPTLRNAALDFSNNLFNKGYWNAADSVRSAVGNHQFWRNLPTVGRSSGVVGLTSFCGSDVAHLKSRYNAKLCRYEVRKWTFRATSRRKQTHDYPGLLQYFTEQPSPLTKWEHGIQERPRTSDGLRWEDTGLVTYVRCAS